MIAPSDTGHPSQARKCGMCGKVYRDQCPRCDLTTCAKKKCRHKECKALTKMLHKFNNIWKKREARPHKEEGN